MKMIIQLKYVYTFPEFDKNCKDLFMNIDAYWEYFFVVCIFSAVDEMKQLYIISY